MQLLPDASASALLTTTLMARASSPLCTQVLLAGDRLVILSHSYRPAGMSEVARHEFQVGSDRLDALGPTAVKDVSKPAPRKVIIVSFVGTVTRGRGRRGRVCQRSRMRRGGHHQGGATRQDIRKISVV